MNHHLHIALAELNAREPRHPHRACVLLAAPEHAPAPRMLAPRRHGHRRTGLMFPTVTEVATSPDPITRDSFIDGLVRER